MIEISICDTPISVNDGDWYNMVVTIAGSIFDDLGLGQAGDLWDTFLCNFEEELMSAVCAAGNGVLKGKCCDAEYWRGKVLGQDAERTDSPNLRKMAAKLVTNTTTRGSEMEKIDLERDFYTVNTDHTIELRGWMEERDNDWPGFEDDDMPRYTLVTGDWPDVYDPKCEMTDWAAPYQQYNSDMHYEDAVRFMRGYWGTYLPMSDVDENTPAGDYWCYFSDEPARREN